MPANALSKVWTGRSNFLADNGAYQVATNPTPGTALAFGINATFDVTKSLLIFRNKSPNVGGKRMHLDYIKLIPTIAPASGTAAHFAFFTDTINRYTSGGTLMVPVNPNGDDTTGAIGDVYAGSGGTVITTATAGNLARLVARGVLRSVIPAVGDEMVVAFGAAPTEGGSSATAAGRTATPAPAIVLGPGQYGVFNVWFPSNAATGLSYEFEAGWAEL